MDYKNELEKKIEHKVTDHVAKGFKIFFFALFMVGLLFLIGYVVMLLWNWLMPELFGLTAITYWQAMGILILAKIIFGFGGGKGPGKKYKGKWKSQRTPKSCGPLRKDFSEWKYYDRFWKEEGESAFKAYVEKQRNHGEKE